MTEKIRLQRYLSSAGVAARRKAEELIVAGHVRVNGKQVRLLGSKVDPDRDHVTVNGEAIHPLDKFYVVFNKPKGCVTAVEDDRGRATVMEYLPNLPVPVRPVGRLDYYAEGVVLLTNDGELAARLTSSQREVPKTYHVKVQGEVSQKHLESLRAGVRLEDGSTTQPAEVNFLPGESRHSWLGITVVENKQHQVQRMLEALGYLVQKLQCVAFATLNFHGLRVGDGRELNQSELNTIRDLVDLDHSVTTRGAWRTFREDTDIPRRAREKLRVEAAEAEAEAGEPISDWRDADADYEQRPATRGPRDDRGPAARSDRSKPAARSARDERPAARSDRSKPSRGAGPSRSFSSDDRAPRGDRGKPASRGPGARSFNSDDRAPRAARGPGPSRSFSSDDRAPRTTRGANPSRSFNSDDRAPRTTRGANPSRSFNSDDRAARGPSAAPSRSFTPDDRGARPDRGRPSSRGPGASRSFGDATDRPSRPGVRSGTSFGSRDERPASRSPSRSFGNRDERPASRSPSRSGTSFGAREDRPSRGRPDRPSRGPAAAPRTDRAAAPRSDRPSRGGQSAARSAAGTDRPRFGQSTPAARPSSRPASGSARPAGRPASKSARPASGSARPAGRPTRRK